MPIGDQQGSCRGAPPAAPSFLGAPSGAPLGAHMGAPLGGPVGAPGGAPLGGPVGAPEGGHLEAPVGGPVGGPVGAPVGAPGGAPVGGPVGAPEGGPWTAATQPSVFVFLESMCGLSKESQEKVLQTLNPRSADDFICCWLEACSQVAYTPHNRRDRVSRCLQDLQSFLEKSSGKINQQQQQQQQQQEEQQQQQQQQQQQACKRDAEEEVKARGIPSSQATTASCDSSSSDISSSSSSSSSSGQELRLCSGEGCSPPSTQELLSLPDELGAPSGGPPGGPPGGPLGGPPGETLNPKPSLSFLCREGLFRLYDAEAIAKVPPFSLLELETEEREKFVQSIAAFSFKYLTDLQLLLLRVRV